MLARDYKIRVFIVFLFFVTLFAIICTRLFLIQVRQKNFFKILAKNQYELEIKMDAPRALIVDSSGKFPLACNRMVPSAFVVPQQFSSSSKGLKYIRKHYPEVYGRIQKNPHKRFLWLDRKLSSEKYQQLVDNGFSDIYFIEEHQRFYPLQATAQLIGMTDIDNVGTAGLELAFGERLRGQASHMLFEKDARSGAFYFEKKILQSGKLGVPLQISVDHQLQIIAYQELRKSVMQLGAKGGSVIVLDALTGEVKAMTNYPSFDPNQKGIEALELVKNGVVNECYELGSVLKVFCGLAALEEGVVEFDEPIDCEGRYGYIDGIKVENPTLTLLRRLKEKNNILPFHEVLRYSSNVGIAKVAKRLGPRLYQHLRRLGFGSKTNIEFPGERSGFVNPPERWSKPSVLVMSFGYELMTTLMQLAKSFAIVANGGYDVQPTLLISQDARPGRKLYKDESIEKIKSIMEQICARYPLPGVRVMGKTGTARCVKEGRYSTKDHIYTFAGILEKDSYRRVIITFIKEPAKASLWATETALPLFVTLAERMVVHDKIHHNLLS